MPLKFNFNRPSSEKHLHSPKWPDGKKHSRNIYAYTESECEEKLAELIQQTKMEIAEAKRLAVEGK